MNNKRHLLDDRSPIFVMGCPDSGNNLLALMLNAHSNISIFLGTHYYPLFAPDRHRYGNLRNRKNAQWLVRDLAQTIRARDLDVDVPSADEVLHELTDGSFEGVLTAFLRVYARRHGKSRIGERTSRHFIYLQEILERYPTSPVVYTMRDPRDIAVNLREGLQTPFEITVLDWNRALRNYREAARPVHLVRYEKLVTRPEQTLQAVCDFLGENFEPQMLEFYRSTPQHFRRNPHHRKLASPLDTEDIGVYKQLTQKQLAFIEAGCASGMEYMGYAFSGHRPKTDAEIVAPAPPGFLTKVVNALRYYGLNRERWRLGFTRWKIVLRLRVRYIVGLGFLR